MSILRDTKFVFRLFLKNSGSSLLGVTVLGLGLGMSITIFALVNGILWSSPKVTDGENLVRLRWANEQQQLRFDDRFTHAEYSLISQYVKSLRLFTAYSEQKIALYYPGSGASTQRYQLVRVKENFFEHVATKPLLGRVLNDSDFSEGSGGVRSVILSYGVWQEQFSGLRDALGKRVFLSGMEYVVVGVMPPKFRFPSNKQLWVSLRDGGSQSARFLNLFGVLNKDWSRDKSEAELEILAKRLEEKYPDSNRGRSKIIVEPYNLSFVDGNLRTVLQLLSVASLLVFIVACANVSNLVMVRVSRRQHELVVRKTLGASRYQIIIQVILEGFLFSVGGLVVGLVLNLIGARFVWSMFQQSFATAPDWWNMTLDWKVYLFAVIVMLAAIATSSLMPAIRALTRQSNNVLQENAKNLSGLFVGKIAKGFVAVQIMCLTVLMVMSLLMALLLHYLTDWDLPFNPNQILTARIQLNTPAGFTTNESIDRFYDDVTRELQALPGVKSVGFSFHDGGILQSPRQFIIEGEINKLESETNYAGANIISNGFFKVFDMQPILGRLFLETDVDTSQKVAVVNQHFVDAYFKNKNPLGKRLRVYRPASVREVLYHDKRQTDWMVIVGVVPNIQRKLLPGEQSADLAEIYIPVKQRRARNLPLLLRVDGDIKDWIKPTRQIIHNQAPLLAPNGKFQTVQNFFDGTNSTLNAMAKVVTLFGVAALIITVVGLYGLVSFTTLLQRREFGIRSALGGDSNRIIELVFKRAAWLLSFGLFAGIAVATAISNELTQSLGVMNLPVNMPSHLIGIGIVIAVSLIAIAIPALQAARVSPNEALRAD